MREKLVWIPFGKKCNGESNNGEQSLGEEGKGSTFYLYCSVLCSWPVPHTKRHAVLERARSKRGRELSATVIRLETGPLSLRCSVLERIERLEN